MNDEQLRSIVSSLPCVREHFIGVFGKNHLPAKKIQWFPAAVIINSEPFPRPGHWLAVLFKDRTRAEFYDSLGHRPSYYGKEIVSFIKNNSTTCLYINRQLQPTNSDTCGLYVLYFLVKRLVSDRGQGLHFREFGTDLQGNDNLVRWWFFTYMRTD